MSQAEGLAYPPLTPRHKRVFLLAALAALAWTLFLGACRLALIRWWLAACTGPSQTCRWVELAFTWWWIPMVAGVLVVALVAHRLTLDRLVRQ